MVKVFFVYLAVQGPVVPPAGPIQLSPEQLSKLRSELDIVQQNFKVFSEMLTELTPGQEDPSDWDLLQVQSPIKQPKIMKISQNETSF